ncbi:MAG: glycosyltransferase family 4 protein [Planctomycetaceae bacterium]|jgi:glycosyltransferase involved in cell wall biosynthesis|nr:glycosyltransferase family 4 protein [Planctomycetaceae bacterium]
MNILVLDEWLPSMHNSGKSIRTFQLLAPLAKQHRITYLAHCDSADQTEKENVRKMEDAGFEVVGVPRSFIYNSVPKIILGTVPSLLHPLPISVRRHFSHNYVLMLQKLVREKHFDLVHIEWTHYAVYSSYINTLPQFICTHNVEYLSWQRFTKTTRNPFKIMLGIHEARKLYRFEKKYYHNADYLSIVSDNDAQLLRNEFELNDFCIIPNGVTVTAYDEIENTPKPNHLVYCGSMDVWVNQDAVTWFIRNIFPLILKKNPAVTLTVIGRNPPDWILKLQTDRIHFTGSVSDIRLPLKEGCLEIVPLRIAGGSRLKILEALAAKIPVLSTTIGAEGLNVEHNKNIVLADDPASFANHCIELLGNPKKRTQLVQAGRQLVEEQYDWKQISPLVETAWIKTIDLFKEKSHAKFR